MDVVFVFGLAAVCLVILSIVAQNNARGRRDAAGDGIGFVPDGSGGGSGDCSPDTGGCDGSGGDGGGGGAGGGGD